MHTVRSLSALALVAAVASSPMPAQESGRALRGSQSGTLLRWTPTTDFASYDVNGGSRSTLRYGSLSVLAHAGDWSSAYLTSQRSLFGGDASERSLRYSSEVFWVDLDEVGALIDQFASANHRGSGIGYGQWTANGDAASNANRDERANAAPFTPGAAPASDWPRLYGRSPNEALQSSPEQAPRLTLEQRLFEPGDMPLALDASELTTVPEPSTYLLVASGLLIIVLLARRRPVRVRRSLH